MDKAYTVWLTGLSGSGKTTLSKRIGNYIENTGKPVQILDGDIVREEIGQLFGYSREERIKASKVLRFLAKRLNENGIFVIVSAIAPYQEVREGNRKEIPNYLELFINCPIETCIERDVKGLYKRALRGEEKNVIGIDDVYETPITNDFEVNTSFSICL